MLYVDARAGSKELFPLFPPGTAKITKLEFGDFAFTGNGPNDKILKVGIERKTMGDLLTCLKDGRISEQLLGMRQMYDVSYLLHESDYTEDALGYIKYFQNGAWFGTQFTYKHIWGFLNTIELRAGLHVFKTEKITESAKWIFELHSWFNDKEFEQHRAHLAPHIDLDPDFRKGREKASLLRRTAAQLKGVGHDKAIEIEKAAGTMNRFMSMSEFDFTQIPGIGKTLSESVWKELHETITNRKESQNV